MATTCTSVYIEAAREKYEVVPPSTSSTCPNGVFSVSSPRDPTTSTVMLGCASTRVERGWWHSSDYGSLEGGSAGASALDRDSGHKLGDQRFHSLVVLVEHPNHFLDADGHDVRLTFESDIPVCNERNVQIAHLQLTGEYRFW